MKRLARNWLRLGLVQIEKILKRLGYELRWWPTPLIEDPARKLSFDVEFVLAHLALRKRDMFVLEIGANDGVSGGDPLYPWIKKFGWHAVLLEPIPEVFGLLEKNYDGQQGVTLMNAALDERDGTRTLYVVEHEKGSLVKEDGIHSEYRSCFASFIRESLLAQTRWVPNVAELISEIEVECVTFETILERTGRTTVDILQIDVEGFDYQVIKMIDFSLFKPTLINFEHCLLTKSQQDECAEILTDQGYQLTRGERDTTAYLMRPLAHDQGH